MTLSTDIAAETSGTSVPVTKPPEPPKSRVHSDPKLWEEACEFANMLAYCRPHLSRTERKFIGKYLTPLGVTFDKKGNIVKQIGENPTVLWSSHTDTVHHFKGIQAIQFWPHGKTGEVWFEVDQRKTKSSCLGADDTCGVWLMTQMIKANKPGLYIFHRGEECGGKGSKWIAEFDKERLKGIKFAIAFDRKDEKSIITYQRGKRCCSDEFAKSLAAELGMGHECDTGGSFTDTASYTDLIPECTNVSVGYQHAHCSGEHTNVDYLFRLRDALLKLDVSKLVEVRKPGESPSLYQTYVYKGNSNTDWESDIDRWNKAVAEGKLRGGLTGLEVRKKCKGMTWMDQYHFDSDTCLWFPNAIKAKKEGEAPGKRGNGRKTDLGVTKVMTGSHGGNNNTVIIHGEDNVKHGRNPTYLETLRMIRDNDAVIADLLESLGYGPGELRDHLLDVGATGNTIRM